MPNPKTRSQASKSSVITDGQAASSALKKAVQDDKVKFNSEIKAKPYVHFNEHLTSISRGWQIKESLLFSFYFGTPTMTSEDFIKLKSDYFVSAMLGDQNLQLSVKKERGSLFLGKPRLRFRI